MSIDVNWANSSNNSGNHFLTQEYGRHVLLSTPSLTALGLPNDGTKKFATIVYTINAGATSSSDASAVDSADDLVVTYTYLDGGTADERIQTVTHASSALGLSYTETFEYAGSSGTYRISSITRS